MEQYLKKWPTLPPQETPGNQAICSTDGDILMRIGNQGTLTKVLGIKYYGTSHWIPSGDSENNGYYQSEGFMVLDVGGFPIAQVKYVLNNVINGNTLCRLSSSPGVIEPNQTTLSFAPNLEMDLNKDTPDGRYIIDDRFIYGPINPQTNLYDEFTNIRNVSAATPGTDSQMIELYFKRIANKEDCDIYPAYLASSGATTNSLSRSAASSQELPNLETDLTKVWTLDGGVKMTGADIRKALLGY